MKKYLLPEEGNFYKVNMHCHTTVSDGLQTPQEVKDFFKSRGYSAVCYTDHYVLVGHEDLCDDEFIALHGYEVDISEKLNGRSWLLGKAYHLNMIAKEQSQRKIPYYKTTTKGCGNSKEWFEKVGEVDGTIDESFYDPKWVNDYIKKVSEKGFFVNYNHPKWSIQCAFDYVGLDAVHSVELLNTGCFNHGDVDATHYETMLRYGVKACPTGGDDNHSQKTCGKAWTMIKAKELTYSSLIEAYGKGDCYASSGPEILELYYEDDKISVKTSPAAKITMHSEGREVQVKKPEEGADTLSCAEFLFNPKKQGKFIRIEVEDRERNRAFSNAYYTEDIIG